MNIFEENGISLAPVSTWLKVKHVLSLCTMKAYSIDELFLVARRVRRGISTMRQRNELLLELVGIRDALNSNLTQKLFLEKKIEKFQIEIKSQKMFITQQLYNKYMEHNHRALMRGQTLTFSISTAEKWLSRSDQDVVEGVKSLMMLEDVFQKQLATIDALSNNLNDVLLKSYTMLSYSNFSDHIYRLSESIGTIHNVHFEELGTQMNSTLSDVMQMLRNTCKNLENTEQDVESGLDLNTIKTSTSDNVYKKRLFDEIFESASTFSEKRTMSQITC